MKHIDNVKQWLANPQRKYAEGIAIFDAIATKAMKEKVGSFLHEVVDADQLDIHYTTLVEKLSKCRSYHALGQLPSAENEVEEAPLKAEKKSEAGQNTTENPENTDESLISELQDKINDLQTELYETTSDGEESAEKIAELENSIAGYNEQLMLLMNDVDFLKRPGIKVVSEKTLPDYLLPVYAHIKDIVPIMAKFHAELCNESITDDERKELAENICALDDERRKAWDMLDTWAEGKEMKLEVEKPVYEETDFLKGLQMSRRIKRLRENISNSTRALESAQASGRSTIATNAQIRIDKYTAELSELETALAELEKLKPSQTENPSEEIKQPDPVDAGTEAPPSEETK